MRRGAKARHGSISIHALREEGDGEEIIAKDIEILISIHALREEGDLYNCMDDTKRAVFLSTPSARRATAPLLILAISP